MFEEYKLQEIFNKYLALRNETDKLYQHITGVFPNEAVCKKGCASCCYALFDLSLVEAMYIHKEFFDKFPIGQDRSEILNNAGQIDRQLTKIKRDYYKAVKNGMQADDLLAVAAAERIACPMLTKDNLCVIYEFRPITCRVYGVPTAFDGQGHVCGESGFIRGTNYPTIFMDKIQDKLSELSLEIQNQIDSKFKELHKTYVPISMMLHNKYDDIYLGKKHNAPPVNKE